MKHNKIIAKLPAFLMLFLLIPDVRAQTPSTTTTSPDTNASAPSGTTATAPGTTSSAPPGTTTTVPPGSVNTNIVVRLSSTASPEQKAALKDSLDAKSVKKLSVEGTELWSIPRSKLPDSVSAGNNNPAVDYIEHPNAPLDQLLTSVPRANLDPSQKIAIQNLIQSKVQIPVNVTSLDAAAFKSNQMADGVHDIKIPLSPGKEYEFTPRKVINNADGGFAWVGDLKTGQANGQSGGATLTVTPDNRISGQILIGTTVYNVTPLGSNLHAITKTNPNTDWKDEPPAFDKIQKRENPASSTPLTNPGPGSGLETTNSSHADTAPLNTGSAADSTSLTTQSAPAPPPPLTPKAASPPSMADTVGPICTEPGNWPVSIRVLVLYTPAAGRALNTLTNPTGAADLANTLVADANENVYPNSQIPVQLTLAAVKPVDFNEGQTWERDVSLVQSSAKVQDMRRQVQADIVVVLVDKNQYPDRFPDQENTYCGWSKMINADANDAYSLVDYQCAPAPNYSFIHEIGHLEGTRHDACTDKDSNPFPYGHGFCFFDYSYATNGWRTVESYTNCCRTCPRVAHFSNPNVRIGGIPSGSSTLEDDARVIKSTAPCMAHFHEHLQ